MKEQCRKSLEIAVQILDGQSIPAEDRLTIESHLDECAPCFERLGVEREVKNLIARLKGSEHCPDHLRTKIVAIFEEGPSA